MENFSALPQRNVLNSRAWRTREDLRDAIVHWIEHTYNRRRRQRGFGRLTPVEFERAFTNNAAQAAALSTQHVSMRPAAIPRSALADEGLQSLSRSVGRRFRPTNARGLSRIAQA